jgi:hypothetical protein
MRTKEPPSSARLLAALAKEELSSITAIHTALVTLPPALVQALTKFGPKKRSSKVPLVIALGIASVFLALGMDASAREFAVDRAGKASAFVHNARSTAVVVAPQANVVAAPRVVIPTVVRPAPTVETIELDDPPTDAARKAPKKPATKQPSKRLEPRAAPSLKKPTGLVAVQLSSRALGS